jgi:BirA family biotin operon repressor/biotin-[acetyl-CoA-carboxylase] ligase
MASPDRLSLARLRRGLRGSTIGGIVVLKDHASSTQSLAKKLAERGGEDGLVVVAETQSAGRGRLGRSWVSGKGGLWFTVLLRPKAHPRHAQAFACMASLSVKEALRDVAGIEAWLKWPNDVFVGSGKVCGVLSEVAATGDQVRYLLLGVGLNVNNEVSGIEGGAYAVTSVREASGRTADRNALLASILRRLDQRRRGALGDDFTETMEEYRSSCATIGQEVRVSFTDHDVVGQAIGIDEGGALQLKTKEGVLTVSSGDVIHLAAFAGQAP